MILYEPGKNKVTVIERKKGRPKEQFSVFDPETETIFTIKIKGSRVLEFKQGGTNHGKN